MSSVPRFSALSVSGYAMYPGTPEAPGIVRDLDPGTTLIIGANGLGKTTLLTIVRHLCAGPYRLSNRGGTAFGAGALDATRLDGRTFADRVSDRASHAEASLTMLLDSTEITVTRSLRNLSLLHLIVNGHELSSDEDQFQDAIVNAADLASFADWLLIVDHLVFVTEDRLLPFWDKDVQRHLLRVLISGDSALAGLVSEAESDHISADSEFRNARAQLTRHKKRYEELTAQLADKDDVLEELAQLAVQRDSAVEALAQLEEELDAKIDGEREAARANEVVEVQYQLAVDALEVARLELIEESMPSQDDVLKYLRSRVGMSSECPACGRPEVDLDDRVSDGRCFLCGETLELGDEAVPEALAELETRITRAAEAIDATQNDLTERRTELTAHEATLAGQRRELAEIDRQARALRARLPHGDHDLVSSRSLIAELEEDLAELKATLDESRERLDQLLESQNQAVQARQDEIKLVFEDVATRFMVESCHLVPHEASLKIGQEGGRFNVQGFDLDLGSSTELGDARRNTRDQVSESQRIYVDIAFRIALLRTCAKGGSGSLAIDAPEGSLDAVFATNAAHLLAGLTEGPGNDNRLVIATNLIEGSLLPALAREGGIADKGDQRLIDLIEIAAPTAALIEYREKYRSVRDGAFEVAGGG